VPDLYIGRDQGIHLGIVAGIVAAHPGVNAKGGPQGVGTG